MNSLSNMNAILFISFLYFHFTFADQWTQWIPWTACSKICGAGMQTRIRTCIPKAFSVEQCIGPDRMEQLCNPQPCNVGRWSEWTPWIGCAVTCGVGNERRTRVCIGGTAGALGCPGLAEENRPCNRGVCPFGYWTPWTPWVGCIKTCGIGQEKRIRVCVAGPSGQNCPGLKEEIRVCNRGLCPNGDWSEWSPWTPCDKPCGPGQKRRLRACIGGAAGGLGCPGLPEEKLFCQNRLCNEGFWTPWTPFGACSTPCGPGHHRRTRTCVLGFPGGPGCPGLDYETKSCHIRPCV